MRAAASETSPRGLRILLVEDERTLAVPLVELLERAGHVVTHLPDGAAALAWLQEKRADLVITDVRLPGADGLQVLRRARSQDPPCEVLVMTGYATIAQAVEAMRGGAAGYLQKPFPSEALLQQVARLAEGRMLQEELRRLREEAHEDALLTGTSAMIRSLNERLMSLARDSEATVLLQGESGTGKERAARALHRLGPRATAPFIPVACGAIPAQLLEGELFGFRRGSFTGADQDRSGLCAEAAEGTLFLDDVENLSPEAQAKLLRLVQERTFRPLGASQEEPFRARLVSSASHKLSDLVAAGQFREDLFYRLHVVVLDLPPLRERVEDLPALLAAFLRRHDPEGRFRVPPETLRRLSLHHWPGNVRELANAAVRAIALAGRARVLRPEHFLPGAAEGGDGAVADGGSLREAVRRAEIEVIRSALAATGGKRIEAANLLGVSRKILWQKIRDLGLGEEELEP
jgi:DNA-binding NtrC family response regulator